MATPTTADERRQQWVTIIVDGLRRSGEPFTDDYTKHFTESIQSAGTDEEFEAFAQNCAQIARDKKQQQALRQTRQSAVLNDIYSNQMHMRNTAVFENNELQQHRAQPMHNINLADGGLIMMGKIRSLRNIFPDIEDLVAKNAILDCNGSIDDAANMLARRFSEFADGTTRDNEIKTTGHMEHPGQIDIHAVSQEDLQEYVEKLLERVGEESDIKLNAYNRTADSMLIADRLKFFKVEDMVSVVKTRLQSQPLHKGVMQNMGFTYTNLRSIPYWAKSVGWRKVFDLRLDLAAFGEIGQTIPQFNHDKKATTANSKNGDSVMAQLQAIYSGLIRGYFDSDEEYNNATSSQKKIIKEQLQRSNVQGHKLSKLVEVFGYGIIACLPDKFDTGKQDRFGRWSMGKTLAMIEIVKLTSDIAPIQALCQMVGEFLDELLDGKKEIAECLAAVDKFSVEHDIKVAAPSS